jgi:hypothetical protein
MAERATPYSDVRNALLRRLRLEQVRVGQGPDLPDPDEIHGWALRLEVLRRLEDAHTRCDLTEIAPLFKRWLYESSIRSVATSCNKAAEKAGEPRL